MENDNDAFDNDVLEITASIEPNGIGGWYIKATNLETGVSADCQSVEAYANFMQESVNLSACSGFKAIWLPSPNAKPEHIQEVRSQLLAHQEMLENMEK
jgi:hypothetical protein